MIYGYKCNKCGSKFEIICTLSEADKIEKKCPDCESKDITKKFFPIPFYFKGNGNYKNDNIINGKK